MTIAEIDAPVVYGEYRGKPIILPTGKFTNMGDGLSKAMEIEGGVDEPGEIVTFVVACRVGPHTLDLTEDGEAYTIKMTYIGGTVARVDLDLVREVLVEMERRVKENEDAKQRAGTLDGVDEAATAAAATSTDPSGLKVVEGTGGAKKGRAKRTPADDEPGAFHDATVDGDRPNELVGAGVGGNDEA